GRGTGHGGTVMALWKRIAFWVVTFLVLMLVVAAILLFSIDRSIKIYPGVARDVLGCRTLPKAEAFLGGPPGDYTTVPYRFDPPESMETAEQKERRHKFMESFRPDGRRWISDDGCVMVSLDGSGN